MKMRKLLLGAILAGLMGLGLWLGWRWLTTPAVPVIALDGLSSTVAELIEPALEQVHRQPRSGEAWGNLGMVLAANGFETQGLQCLVQAERFDPHNPRWPYVHGVQLLADSPRAGMPLLRRALPLARTPDKQAAILFRLALALIEDGQLEEAGQRLHALRSLDGDSPRLHFGLGLLDIAREDRVGARQHLSLLADNPFARKRVCGLLATLTDGDRDLAHSYQQRAAALPPDAEWPDPLEGTLHSFKVDRTSRIGQFWDMEAQGRHAEALEYLRTVVATRPDAEVCYALGMTLFKKNEFEQAEEALRTATRFSPQKAKTYFFLGAALFARGENRHREPGGKEQALELFRQAVTAEDRALALQSNFGDAHLIRGLALKYLGRQSESLQALREALRCRPEFSDAHLHLGEALAEAGQLQEGLEHLKNAVRLASPADPRPRAALEKWQGKVRTVPKGTSHRGRGCGEQAHPRCCSCAADRHGLLCSLDFAPRPYSK